MVFMNRHQTSKLRFRLAATITLGLIAGCIGLCSATHSNDAWTTSSSAQPLALWLTDRRAPSDQDGLTGERFPWKYNPSTREGRDCQPDQFSESSKRTFPFVVPALSFVVPQLGTQSFMPSGFRQRLPQILAFDLTVRGPPISLTLSSRPLLSGSTIIKTTL